MKKEQPADGCSSSKREGISYWFITAFGQCFCENIGEFSQIDYSMWDGKCPAKNNLCQLIVST